MNNQIVHALQSKVIQIAKNAGEIILKFYRTGFSTEYKADGSPLTDADQAANTYIRQQLSTLAMNYPILSEETALPDYEIRKKWPMYWLVDPLDGTQQFVQQSDEFSVNIALIADDKPVMGVIYAPALDILAYATKKHGAFQQYGSATPQRIQVKTHTTTDIRILTSRAHLSERMQQCLSPLQPYERVPMGSAIKFAYLAAGKADMYLRLGPTSEWDTAAGQCIVEEAGGIVTDLSQNILSYNQKDSILNPAFLAAAQPLQSSHNLWNIAQAAAKRFAPRIQ